MGQTNERFRYAIDFSIDDDLRFIAHNDCVRLFSRAAVRAKLPVSFTQGFNPRARVTLPFPRPVGQASDVERVLLDLTEETDAPWLIESLQAQMPDGAVLRCAEPWPRSSPCRPRWVRYCIECADIRADAVSPSVLDLLGSNETLITRVRQSGFLFPRGEHQALYRHDHSRRSSTVCVGLRHRFGQRITD